MGLALTKRITATNSDKFTRCFSMCPDIDCRSKNQMGGGGGGIYYA